MAISSMCASSSNPSFKDTLMKSLSTLFISAALLALVGCNTVKGMGQDLQKAGTTIEDAAKKK
jgi:predicted small secreted protein